MNVNFGLFLRSLVVSILLGFFVSFFVPGSTLLADGGNEPEGYSINVSHNSDTSFTVEKSYPESAVLKKKYRSQKAAFSYRIDLIVEDAGDDTIIGTHTFTSAIPAGKDSIVIDVKKYVTELKKKIKMRGRVAITLETPSGVRDYVAIGVSDAISVYNSGYQQQFIDNSDLAAQWSEDYNNFIMENQGKDINTINREFLKKYPQYKEFMPYVK
ncbi:MAG TPA: hypothetical protein PL059_00640 [Spirochaetota bacterium]|nr:hypothetical protein [Spirochaetota bacterium]HOM08641.1 hypothetical protein [Spirochaetota bacterium]HPP48460.1 hypothetical protein [Spirochaetota bacterium]